MSRRDLRVVVASVLGRAGVPEDGDFGLREAGLDSLGMIDLVAALETEYAIRVAPEDITPENFTTFEGLRDFVASRDGSHS